MVKGKTGERPDDTPDTPKAPPAVERSSRPSPPQETKISLPAWTASGQFPPCRSAPSGRSLDGNSPAARHGGTSALATLALCTKYAFYTRYTQSSEHDIHSTSHAS